MTFVHPWLLLLALAPMAWAVWEWRSTARKAALLLKAAALTCIALATAQPRLSISETKVAVAVLADASASVSDADLQKESQVATDIEKRRGSNWMQVMPFARTIRNTVPEERVKSWR